MITSEGQSDFLLPLIAKDQECVVDRPHKLSKSIKNRDFFETKKSASCARDGRRVLTDAGVGCVVFAHKTTEGWESLISGIVRSGWSITASWPIATELKTRLNARDTASLGTSVHLVCRPRPVDAKVGDWADVLRELPSRVGDWMERLQGEGVRGADLVFACIGPALEIFSRYRGSNRRGVRDRTRGVSREGLGNRRPERSSPSARHRRSQGPKRRRRRS